MRFISGFAWAIMAVIILGAALSFIILDVLIIRPILELFPYDDEGIRTSRDW